MPEFAGRFDQTGDNGGCFQVLVKSKAGLARGSMVDVKLAGIREYDMIGEPIDEYSE